MKTRSVSILWLAAALLLLATPAAQAQQQCMPRMIQDPALDNLQHDAGYATAPLGELGPVIRSGHGPQPMVLIAGAGFGAEIFEGFMEANAERYTMVAVALPGFGGSAAPPMPPEGTSYGEQSWTVAARDAVARMIEKEGLHEPIVVGHWINATQVALGLAVERPELIRAAVIVSGVPKSVAMGAGMAEDPTPEMRALMIDMQMAPGWFKTVTRDTWDDNNFLPRDYAIHPLRGLQLWKDAALPPLPVNIRYLCEYWARDATLDLPRLQVPLLVIKPGLDELYSKGPQQAAMNYMQMFLHDSWEGVEELSDLITMETIDDSRVFMMDDQPEKLNDAIRAFLDSPLSRRRGSSSPAPATATASNATPAAAAAQDDSVPAFWQGQVEREGSRYLVGDATIALELPESWRLEGVADQAPLVVRMHDAAERAEITLQIYPVPGMPLDAVMPLIEAQLQGQDGGFATEVNRRTKLDDHDAVRLEGTYQQDGEPGRLGLILTRLDDDFTLSVVMRAAPDDFEALRPQFDRFAADIDLRMGRDQR